MSSVENFSQSAKSEIPFLATNRLDMKVLFLKCYDWDLIISNFNGMSH